ncbi:hypothetical protein MRX96_010370 [Rhipicephalus microplus]
MPENKEARRFSSRAKQALQSGKRALFTDRVTPVGQTFFLAGRAAADKGSPVAQLSRPRRRRANGSGSMTAAGHCGGGGRTTEP